MKIKLNTFTLVIIALVAIAITLQSIVVQAADNSAEGAVRVDVRTYPENLPLIVDGIIYTPTQTGPNVFYWEKGSKHTISIIDATYYTEPGARLVFDKWNTGDRGSQITVTVAKPVSIIALYNKQYFIETSSPYGSPQGSGWYPEGTRVNITVQEIVEISPGVRAVFKEWTAGVTPDRASNFVYLFNPVTVKAVWNVEYLLKLTSNAPAGLSGEGWYPAGKIVRIDAQPTIDMGNDTQYRFKGWSIATGNLVLENPDNRKQLIPMNGPVELHANYDRYYPVKILSPYGVKGESTTYYKEGSYALVNLDSPIIVDKDTRKIFAGWENGARSNPLKIKVDQPVTLVAEWKTQYKLSIESKLAYVKGDGWYDEGSKATVTALGEVSSRYGSKYVFNSWQGDVKSTSRTLNITMDSPKHIEAIWNKSYMGTYEGITVFTVIVLMFYYVYKKYFIQLAD